MTRRPATLLLALLAAGCGGTAAAPSPAVTPPAVTLAVTPPATGPVPGTQAPARPTTTPPPRPALTVAPTTRAPAPVPTWVVGASPLPVGPDGFGIADGTPPALRDRSLQQPDVLPPPLDGRFASTAGPITPAIRTRMGTTYAGRCPVPLRDLRYVTLVFRGFDGRAHTGELVVAAKAVDRTVAAFRRLFALGFPLEEMRLPTTADLEAEPTGDGNDTAAFVCRAARGQTRFSAHAYGLAIDVNPFQNPYVKGDLVLPELAGAYTDRDRLRRGMLVRGSAAVRAFTDQGFTWGGDFRSLKDYQHMTLTGD